MGDLEEVDVREAAPDELGIDALLDVAGQQEPVLADLAEEHDRDVVDRRPAVGWSFGHPVRVGPEDAKADPVEAQPVARRQATAWRPTVGQPRRPCPVAGTRPDHARLVHAADPIAREQRGQARHVVLVRVGQDQDVDAAVPRRESFVERDEQASGIRPTVDDESPTPVTLDQDPVALPDVEDHDADDPVGPVGERHGQRHRGGREGDRGDLHSPGGASVASGPTGQRAATYAGA
jgi:hypothetical protein